MTEEEFKNLKVGDLAFIITIRAPSKRWLVQITEIGSVYVSYEYLLKRSRIRSSDCIIDFVENYIIYKPNCPKYLK